MRYESVNSFGASVFQSLHSECKSVPGVNHIVNQDGNLGGSKVGNHSRRQNDEHTLSRTSPTSSSMVSGASFIPFARPRWMSANSTFSLSAIAVTLPQHVKPKSEGRKADAHRFAPPASGLTMTEFCQPRMLRLIHPTIAGSE